MNPIPITEYAFHYQRCSNHLCRHVSGSVAETVPHEYPGLGYRTGWCGRGDLSRTILNI